MYPLGVAACVDIGYTGLIGNRVMTGVYVEHRDVEVGSLVAWTNVYFDRYQGGVGGVQ